MGAMSLIGLEFTRIAARCLPQMIGRCLPPHQYLTLIFNKFLRLLMNCGKMLVFDLLKGCLQ